VFLGGGTPSLFSPDEIGELIDAIRDRFVLAEGLEVTMEANPGTVECGDPGGYRDAGVNRLSIGAQSFDSRSLQTLGRIHTVDDIVRAANDAHDAGITNFNLDLMYGLPEQDVAAAMHDIERAAELRPAHISWYQLTLEPNTVFHARPPAGLPDNDLSAEIQQRGQELLAECGYQQYEVSAYARDRQYCAHNLNYWSFGDYLAAGAGAHGKISDETGIWRYAKTANPQQYMDAQERRHRDVQLRALTEPELLFEFMLNALRLTAGFDEQVFRARTGLAPDGLRERLDVAMRQGLISRPHAGFWRPTSLGQRFLNDLQAAFLPD
jgi:putative oxygen-independent coproporphyrinogen III oxidase